MKDKLDKNSAEQLKWIKSLLETLIRAAMQGIPFVGSSLHQLTYGYRDSIEFDKIKSSVESLQNKINSFLTDKKDLILDDASDIANELIYSDHFQDTLSETKSLLITEDMQFIGELITYIELKLAGKDEKLFNNIESLKSTIKDEQASHSRDIKNLFNFQEKQIQKIDNLLKQFESFSKHKNHYEQQDLIKIIQKLKSSNLTPLTNASQNIIVAEKWLTNSSAAKFLSLDTHEIIQYGYAPYQLNTGSLNLSVSVLFSRKFPKSYVLFPATAKELQSFLVANRRYLSDPQNFLLKFKNAKSVKEIDPLIQHIIANVVSPRESPFTRIYRFLSSGCVVQYRESYQAGKKYNDLLEDAMAFLCTVRRLPAKRFANYVDAANLAQIAILNLNSPNSSRAVTSLNSIKKAAIRLKENFKLSTDLVVDPITLVTSRYLENLTVIDKSELCASAVNTNRVNEFIENIINILRTSKISEIISLGENTKLFRNDIELFVNSINPFHTLLSLETLEDWKIPVTNLSTKQEQQFEASYEELLKDLSALLEWFEPFEEAMQPFNEVAEKLSKNENPIAQPDTSADAEKPRR